MSLLARARLRASSNSGEKFNIIADSNCLRLTDCVLSLVDAPLGTLSLLTPFNAPTAATAGPIQSNSIRDCRVATRVRTNLPLPLLAANDDHGPPLGLASSAAPAPPGSSGTDARRIAASLPAHRGQHASQPAHEESPSAGRIGGQAPLFSEQTFVC